MAYLATYLDEMNTKKGISSFFKPVVKQITGRDIKGNDTFIYIDKETSEEMKLNPGIKRKSDELESRRITAYKKACEIFNIPVVQSVGRPTFSEIEKREAANVIKNIFADLNPLEGLSYLETLILDKFPTLLPGGKA